MLGTEASITATSCGHDGFGCIIGGSKRPSKGQILPQTIKPQRTAGVQ